jgi:hypothetical protein
MSKSKSTQNLQATTKKVNKTYSKHEHSASPERESSLLKNANLSPLENMITTHSYPRFTSRYKTYYMKEYKQKKRVSNVCYNPNTRVHTKQQHNIDGLTTNNV